MNVKRKRKALKRYYQYQSQPFAFFLGCITFWIALAALCSLFFTPLADATGNSHSYWMILAPLTLAVTAIISSSIHLTIHEDALEYHTLFKHVVIAWRELNYLDVEESSDSEGTSYNYFLYLKDKDSARLDIGAMVPIRHKRNSAGCLVDIDHLLTTPFGQDLLRYAPHVIEATRNKQAFAEKWYAEVEAQTAEHKQRTLQARTVNRTAKPIRSYPLFRHRPAEFLLAAGIYSFILFIGIGLLLSFMSEVLKLFVQSAAHPLLYIAMSIVLGFWYKSRTGMTVYESGLQYRITLQSNIFIGWDELSHLQAVSPKSTLLCLKDSKIPPLNIEHFVTIKHRWHEGTRIADVAHLLSTPFGQDLQRYAPHVIEATQNEANETQ